MLGRRGEDQRFTESRPAAARRRAIDEAMPFRGEHEERADVARRLYGENYVEDDPSDFDSAEDDGWDDDDPSREQ